MVKAWELVFAATVLGAGAIVLGYIEIRRILHAAVDDRYGQWERFRSGLSQLPSTGERAACRLHYAVAFLFAHGWHDFSRLCSLVLFDLFVIFACFSPFWRYVFFDDWNAALAIAISLAGALLYAAWKVRMGLGLCRVHAFSEKTWRCERCGEFHARAEDPEHASSITPGHNRWWHRFWERRLEQLSGKVEKAR